MAGTGIDDEGIPDPDTAVDGEQESHPRLIDPGDEDVDTVDVEKDSIATMVEGEGALSAEEAAMHITEEP